MGAFIQFFLLLRIMGRSYGLDIFFRQYSVTIFMRLCIIEDFMLTLL